MRPISVRANICQIVPTTLNGISKGSAISTRTRLDQKPFLGMFSATKIPSGT